MRENATQRKINCGNFKLISTTNLPICMIRKIKPKTLNHLYINVEYLCTLTSAPPIVPACGFI